MMRGDAEVVLKRVVRPLAIVVVGMSLLNCVSIPLSHGEKAVSTVLEWANAYASEGNTISFLVLAPIDRISVTGFSLSDTDLKEYKEGAAIHLTERSIQRILSGTDSHVIGIVSRNQIDTALGELELQLSGLVDDEQILRVGRFVGATHIWVLSLTKIKTGLSSGSELINVKAIDIERAQIVAASSYDIRSRRSGLMGDWQPYQRLLDGREYVVVDGVDYWK